ncbi:hypothetical protein FGE12_26200 [Aggregicoccus sp. 17bor-14]|uniref:hypothetical protein n=1 Tax=Myxococcaceae TaxID=31 RepID=UPI00129C4C5F|nr:MULTISPECIES: hypothetical protein [Myxococcaceae]MBF5045930.1 hypothetical protein [Simulacricoccus sp. 17bor-14]MRI91663.1 hypothetical protein [Aggregicoccus sp. 17bor-14]
MTSRFNARTAGALFAVLMLLHAGAVFVSTGSGNPERLPLVLQLAGLGASLLAIAGTLQAARAFGPGDYLRRVWTLFCVSSVLLLVASGMRAGWMIAVPTVSFDASALAPVRTVLVVVVNLLNASALGLLALTYRRSGLRPPRSWKSYGLWLVCAVVAAAAVLPPLRANLALVAAGGASGVQALASVVSALGDMAVILLVAPILRVAYMMRGGRLAWAWWAMAVSGAMWIVYDAHAPLGALLPGGSEGALAALLLVSRTAGIALKGVSGLLQCAALEREAPASEPAPHAASAR